MERKLHANYFEAETSNISWFKILKFLANKELLGFGQLVGPKKKKERKKEKNDVKTKSLMRFLHILQIKGWIQQVDKSYTLHLFLP